MTTCTRTVQEINRSLDFLLDKVESMGNEINEMRYTISQLHEELKRKEPRKVKMGGQGSKLLKNYN